MKTDRLINNIAIGSAFAAIYVALTFALGYTSYGPIQFRISEILMIFPFWNRRYIIPSIIGVAIANMFSPFGLIDVACGVGIAIITYTLIILIKNKTVDIVLYSILCGIIIGFELTYEFKMPFIWYFLSVSASQLIICFLGLLVINLIYRNDYLRELLF